MSIFSCIYASPDKEVEASVNQKVVYTNAYDTKTNIKYCTLRSDVVILGSGCEDEEAFCEWYFIKTVGVKNFDGIKWPQRVSFLGEFTDEEMTKVTKTLVSSEQDIMILLSDTQDRIRDLVETIIGDNV